MTLTPNKAVRNKWHMDRVYTFDIEAYDWVNPVALGMCNMNRNTYKQYTGDTCIESFVDEMLRPKYRNCRFVAHNGGKYDFIPVIEHICDIREERDLEVQILTKGPNTNPFFIKIEDKQGKPRYLQDSMALMPRSLDQLTESFTPDMRKGDFDFDRIKQWDKMDSESKEEMMEYLERDCKSLYRVLEEFTTILLHLTEGNTPPQLTVGSTAMTAYRTHFMPEGMEIRSCHKQDIKQNPEKMIRKSYFGGRTEVFKKYGKDLKHYDVNSLYPYCYTEKPIPIGNVSHTGGHFPIDNDEIGGVVKIKGYVPPESCNGIPVLPHRFKPEEEQAEKVIFPAGEIEGWYMAKEVRYAIEVGSLENVEILDSYSSKYGYPFKDYGDSLYALKNSIDKEKNPAKYKVVKFLLNSFYGKFGMEREHKAVTIGPVTKEFQLGKEMINMELADKGVMLEESESNAPYILPRIASAITAQARIEMHKWFMKVYELGGELWYCDTDSIVTDIELSEGEELGEMDLEGELEEGIYLAPKVYAENYAEESEGELIKAKGMRKPEMTFETYREAYENNEPGLIQTDWETPRGFKSGMKHGEDSWFEVVEQERSLRQFDGKRKWDENGESNPLIL